MPADHDLILFIVAGLLLNMAPGPDSLLVMSRSASGGFRAGASAGLGIVSGTFVHIFAAALGLSALLATSATAFTAVKIAGALYLLYMGIDALLGRHGTTQVPGTAAVPPRQPLGRIFLQGFLTNMLNPKVALFFLAFVPQFIPPGTGSKILSFLLLAALTAFASDRLKIGVRAGRVLQRLTGALFIALGIRLALARP